jgi:hypothetical protein
VNLNKAIKIYCGKEVKIFDDYILRSDGGVLTLPDWFISDIPKPSIELLTDIWIKNEAGINRVRELTELVSKTESLLNKCIRQNTYDIFGEDLSKMLYDYELETKQIESNYYRG